MSFASGLRGCLFKPKPGPPGDDVELEEVIAGSAESAGGPDLT